MRNRVSVWVGSEVKLTGVAALVPLAIHLGGHVEGGGPLAVRGANDAETLQVFELLFGNGKLCQGKEAGWVHTGQPLVAVWW